MILNSLLKIIYLFIYLFIYLLVCLFILVPDYEGGFEILNLSYMTSQSFVLFTQHEYIRPSQYELKVDNVLHYQIITHANVFIL